MIPDAANTGTNVVDGIDESRQQRFVEHAVRSRNKVQEAVNSVLRRSFSSFHGSSDSCVVLTTLVHSRPHRNAA